MVEVNRDSFTELSERGDGEKKLNIIFIHGLRGHPRRTWTEAATAAEKGKTDGAADAQRSRRDFKSFFGLRKERPRSSQRAEPATEDLDPGVFWPEDFLVPDIPQARIWTYGYNADVIGGLFEANNQNSVSQHGRDLAVRMEREIDNSDPIIIVAHSLGGIITKHALHKSNKCKEQTKFIVFLGTPHRGSSYASWGEIASNIIRLGLQDSNKRVLETLNVNGEVLDNIHEEFKSLINQAHIRVHSFQEARGISGMKGLDEKVVNDFSSKLDLPREIETVESIDANHMQMAKCPSRTDARYRAIAGVLKQFTREVVADAENTNAAAKENLSSANKASPNDELSVTASATASSEIEDPLSEKEIKFLNSFSTFYPDDFLDQNVKKPLRGTCSWVLSSSSYSAWIKGESQKVIHIFGKPGSGKSTISRFLFDHAQTSGSWNTILYFSFSEQDQNRRLDTKAYGSLIEQALAQNHGLMRYMLEARRNSRKRKSTNSESDLRKYLKRVIQSAECGKTLMILDTLDECQASKPLDLKEVLEEVVEMVSATTTLKLIILSRPQEQILFSLRTALKINLDTESGLYQDIHTFIKAKVDELVYQCPDWEGERKEIEDSLMQRADGMFLLVKLILEELESRVYMTIDNMRALLRSLPRTVAEAYQRILDKVPEAERAWAKRALTWILYAARPLRPQELEHAIALAPGLQNLADVSRNVPRNFVRSLRLAFGALLGAGKETVYLTHQTAREALLECSSDETKWYAISSDEANELLLMSCCHYLSFDEVQTDTHEIGQLASVAPLIEYAVENFPEHARQLPASKTRAHQTVIEFLFTRKFLSWEPKYWALRDPTRMVGHPLHLACMLGLHTVAQTLVRVRPGFVNTRDATYRTVLDIAAEAGDIEIVGVLLELDADINAIGKDESTPIVTAAWFGHADIVHALLIRGARDRVPAAAAAAEAGHDKVLDVLLYADGIARSPQPGPSSSTTPSAMSYKDVSVGDHAVEVALHTAVRMGQDKMIKYLIQKGFSLTIKDARGHPPLHNAAAAGQVATARLLLENHCNAREMDSEGKTPLHYAARIGHEELCILLLDNGAGIEKQDHNGRTPYLEAVASSQPSICKLFSIRGCNVLHTDAQGQNAFHLARSNSMRDLLSELGVDIGALDNDGRTALHVAATDDLFDAAEYLLEKGLLVNAADLKNRTPLHCAARRGNYESGEVVDVLLNRPDIDVTARDMYGNSPLHLAAQSMNVKVTARLLRKHADPNVQSEAGKTPLHEVCSAADSNWSSQSARNIMEQLLDAKADANAVDERGFTPLQTAIVAHADRVACLLIQRGASLTEALGDKPDTWAVQKLVYFAYTHGEPQILTQLLRGRNVAPEIQMQCLSVALEEQDENFLADIKSHVPMATIGNLFEKELRKIKFDSFYKDGTLAFILRNTKPRLDTLDKNMRNGQTLLSDAAERGLERDVEQLLESGASTEVGDASQGRTALWWAAREGKYACVKLLLEHGADPRNRAEDDGQTVLEVALEYHSSKTQLIELLSKSLKEREDMSDG